MLRTAHHAGTTRQRGAALLVILVIIVMGATTVFLGSLNGATAQIERDQKTAAALAQARDALIGYAAEVKISSSNATNQPRPGDLPCPDTDNDGIAGNTSPLVLTCNLQLQRIGRLPWKTLGLPDLRDGNGERLWYAVSTNFKNSTRIGTLNSDTPGTISIFTSAGNILYDGGASGTGAVAAIIAPSAALLRQGNVTQNRSCTVGVDCDVNERCTTSPPTNTPKCNPINYLDIATVGGITEDNANFTDGLSTDGFIQGRIKDSSGNVILNDQLLVVTQDNIMQAIQKRVAGEVKLCLNEYALNNFGRYPWAVPINNLTTYQDNTNQLFGRIPNNFTNTVADSVSMTDMWGVNCNTHNNNTPSTWWVNWREMVFYGLAASYKPVNPPSTPTACPACLTVNPPSATADKKFVVIVAGKMLPVQIRTSIADKSTPSNYLEAPNSGGATAFAQGAVSTTFNDTVVFP